MARGFPQKEPHSLPSIGESARPDLHLDQIGPAPLAEAHDEEEGSSQPFLQSKPEAGERGRGSDKALENDEEGKATQPEPERGLSRLQSMNLL